MKKYKLIKKYPGSPKLNTIVHCTGTSITYTKNKRNYTESSSSSNNYFKEIILGYPEFWQEVIEKDYKIIMLYLPNNLCPYKIITLSQKNCYARIENGHTIHSIKRLSDGEIFTIGDKNSQGIIDGFNIFDNNELRVHLLEFTDLEYYHINELLPIKRPLFITEDGVDIFEAEKYILMNKPCLSLNDIINSSVPYHNGFIKNKRVSQLTYKYKISNIIKLVKSRL